MRPLYFCWERSPTGRWAPVCYHSEMPAREKVSDGDRASRSTVWTVPDDCRDGEEPLFSRLAATFPAPVEE